LPERIVVLSALPRNPVGKVLKRALREQYGGVTSGQSGSF
jgi:acyl-CoA synthetase (AMP-forming)/AMP-acid ligase II